MICQLRYVGFFAAALMLAAIIGPPLHAQENNAPARLPGRPPQAAASTIPAPEALPAVTEQPTVVVPSANTPVVATPPAASGEGTATAAKPAKPPENIISNPFVSGGVVSSGQVITRDEVLKLITAMEKRVKADVTQGIDAAQVSKLISQATSASNSAGGATNFLGCANGVPLYRAKDGSLSFGADEPDDLKSLRCRK